MAVCFHPRVVACYTLDTSPGAEEASPRRQDAAVAALAVEAGLAHRTTPLLDVVGSVGS